MTAKRFEYIAFDGFTDDGLYITPHKVVDLLNKQHEQIQELQMRYDAQRELYCELDCVKNNLYQENKQLKQTTQRLKENIDELLSINIEEELVKENKQLKAHNQYLIELLESTGAIVEIYKGDVE